MTLHARRRRLASLPSDLVRRASDDGVVHAGPHRQLFGVDLLATQVLPPDQTDPFELPRPTGDEGPPASEPRWHGALPFDPNEPGVALLPATQVCVEDGAVFATVLGDDLDELEARLADLAEPTSHTERDDAEIPGIAAMVEAPSRSHYVELVHEVVREINGSVDLHKVVLARTVDIELTGPLAPFGALQRMALREPTCTRYSLPVGEGRIIGASPELLIAVIGESVTSHPLAGTISLDDVVTNMHELEDSAKDREEHRLVVEDIACRLEPLVDDLDVPDHPSLVALRAVAHLGTSITGRRTAHGSSLRLLRALHPTPAIGGVPQQEALRLIAKLEGCDRGYFGGAVGWSTASGDGEWMLSIRGALLGGSRLAVQAGAGIVAASDPVAEGEETRVKLASILDALLPGSSSRLSST